MKKAVFLDRDGTIILDKDYLADPEKVTIMPDAVETLCEFRKAGYMLIIISNQSGIARGIFTHSEMELVNKKVESLFRSENIEFDALLICPHAPEDNCECRKPLPKLLLDAASEFNINLADSAMIGDKISDAECGIAAGCRYNIFLDNGKQTPPEREDIPVVKNLKDALSIIPV
jgi:D-glycero-D-manno-heptose 1,7-bisphosphate phosphatase